MAIQEFTNDANGQSQALAMPDPKFLWYDEGKIKVMTGSDIPPPVQPDPIQP